MHVGSALGEVWLWHSFLWPFVAPQVFKFARHFQYGSTENQLLLAEGGWIDDLIVLQLGALLGEEECFTGASGRALSFARTTDTTPDCWRS
jgi:hypothetical protein